MTEASRGHVGARLPRGVTVWEVLLAAILAITLAAPSVALAQQPVMDLAAGYSRLHELGESVGLVRTYERGWFVTGSRRLGTGQWAVVGHVDRHDRENFVGEPQSRTAAMGGLRLTLPAWARLSPFAQSVVGWERFFEPGIAEDGFASQSGAGIDVRIWLSLAARLQADYRLVWQNGARYTDWRAGVGVVVMIGR